MANRTDTAADTIHGTNPQYLVDRIIRSKIYNDAYWKEFCFGITTETVIDRAAEIDYVAGTYGGRRRPAKFLCLFLKLLQIQPDEEVVLEYIRQPDLKYLRALGAAYYRIAARHKDVHEVLEPLYADYRKLRYRDLTGKMTLIHMDEFVDMLMREKTVCDVTMPGMPKREILEVTVDLGPYTSVLEDDLDDLEELEEQAGIGKAKDAEEEAPQEEPVAPAEKAASPEPAREASPERKKERRARSSSRRRDRDRRRSRSRSRSASSRRSRSRDRRRKEDRDAKEKKDKKDKKEKEKKEKKKAKEKEAAPAPKSKKDKDGLSVDEWDAVRKELGLAPLKK